MKYECRVVMAVLAAAGAWVHAQPIEPAAGREPGRAAPGAPIGDHRQGLVDLVESFQPADPYLPNRWSQAMRAGFLYGGALRTFTAQSEVVSRYLAVDGPSRPSRAASDLMLSLLDELPEDVPAELAEQMRAEARRLIAILERESILFHLDQLSEPCRLVAPPPYQDENSPLVSQETYELGAFKNLAIVCAARMREQAAAGRTLDAMKSLAAGMRLGRAACGRPMLLALLSGQAIQNRMMLQAIELMRGGERHADAGMPDLVERIEERIPLPAPETFIEMERLIGRDAIDRYYGKLADEAALAAMARAAHEGAAGEPDEPVNPDQPVSNSDGPVTPPPPPPPSPLMDPPVQRLSREEALAALDASLDKCVGYIRRQVPSIDRPADAAVDLPLGPAGDPRLVELPPGREDPDQLVRNLLPPVGQMVIGELEHRAIRAAMRAAVLLERHRAATGRYPADVSELRVPPREGEVSGPAWPRDPCAPERRLGYRARDDGRSYLLYSVGADGRDDGGAAAARPRNALAAGPRGAGTDYVIVPMR